MGVFLNPLECYDSPIQRTVKGFYRRINSTVEKREYTLEQMSQEQPKLMRARVFRN